MKLEFISNTGAFIEHNGIVIGMDIWLTQGAFEGSWYHYPPLRDTHYKIQDCDIIYISHIHPDHCDFNALRNAKKDTLFIVPSYFNDLIKRKLAVFGFYNVESLKGNQSIEVMGSIKLTLFDQFVKSLGSKSAAFGSLIDTALMIEWDGISILNCNDNYLDVETAKSFHDNYPQMDLALMPHSASGPYPASFVNLSLVERQKEAKRLKTEYVSQFVEVTNILSPKLVAPSAAEYVIVGKNWERNEYIGLADADDAVSEWKKFANENNHLTNIVRLDCGTVLDIKTGSVSGLPVRKVDAAEKLAFAKAFRSVAFRYDWEDTCTDRNQLNDFVKSARANLWRMQEHLDWFRDYNFYLRADSEYLYHFNFESAALNIMDPSDAKRAPEYVEARLSVQLLYSVVTGRVHWNNAEGGLHIDFFRDPNIFIPEVYTLMSFFNAK